MIDESMIVEPIRYLPITYRRVSMNCGIHIAVHFHDVSFLGTTKNATGSVVFQEVQWIFGWWLLIVNDLNFSYYPCTPSMPAYMHSPWCTWELTSWSACFRLEGNSEGIMLNISRVLMNPCKDIQGGDPSYKMVNKPFNHAYIYHTW